MSEGLTRPQLPHPLPTYNPALSHMMDKFWGLLSPPGSDGSSHESEEQKLQTHSGRTTIFVWRTNRTHIIAYVYASKKQIVKNVCEPRDRNWYNFAKLLWGQFFRMLLVKMYCFVCWGWNLLSLIWQKHWNIWRYVRNILMFPKNSDVFINVQILRIFVDNTIRYCLGQWMWYNNV